MTKLRLKYIESTTEKKEENIPSHGVLTEWNDDRGYGFITDDASGKKVFLHIKSLLPSARRPIVGELFFYRLTADDNGRPRAAQAYQTVLDERRRIPFLHSIIYGLTFIWPLAILPALVLIAKKQSVAAGIFAAFVLNSLLTILFYKEDKYRAQYKYWRIPEKNLHFWELLCGWPGAMVAQHAFRHKRSKSSFLILFWLCVFANITILFLFLFYGNPKKVAYFLWAWEQKIERIYE